MVPMNGVHPSARIPLHCSTILQVIERRPPRHVIPSRDVAENRDTLPLNLFFTSPLHDSHKSTEFCGSRVECAAATRSICWARALQLRCRKSIM